MNKGFKLIAVLGFGLMILASGCETTSQGSKTYTRAHAQKATQVFYGNIINIAAVTIETEASGTGAIGGGLMGGVIGSTIGAGDGRKLATTAGALLGAAAGSAAESMHGKKAAWEIEVKLDDGSVYVVVQEQDDVYSVGQRVRVMKSSDGTLRVRQ